MLEVSSAALSVVGCYAETATLDAFSVPADAFAARVADDELMIIGPAILAEELVAAAATAIGEEAGIVVDQTDGWFNLVLHGGEAEEAFARLSETPLPEERPAFLQCPIAHVPGKVIALADRLYLLVPSPVGHHLRARVLNGCSDLCPTEADSSPFTFGARTPA